MNPVAPVLAWVAGISALQWQPFLPGAGALMGIGLLSLALALAAGAICLRASLHGFEKRPGSAAGLAAAGACVLALVAAAAAGFTWAGVRAADRLDDALPASWERRDIELIGVIAELTQRTDRGIRFAFDVEQVLTEGAAVPGRILLGWHGWGQLRRAAAVDDGEDDEAAALRPALAGERWHLVVRLRQPRGTVNPHGFDFEAWLLERNFRATGYVRRSLSRLDPRVDRPGYLIERARERIRQRFERVLGDARYLGVLAALAIGDQRAIPAEQWQVFTRTGINHLMSISGLHVTMVAAMAFWLVEWCWRRSRRGVSGLPSRKAATLAGLAAAFGYALLAGFSVPTQRTVFMLLVVALALWCSRRIAPFRVLAWALLLVTVLDPWAVLAPGFWLSFGAVAVLMSISTGRLGRGDMQGDAHGDGGTQAGIRRCLLDWVRAQWAITLGMVPITLALFAQVSVVSPIANAIAIPVISMLVVPVALLSILLPVAGLLHLAHGLTVLALWPIEYLASLPWAVWQQPAPPGWAGALALLGIVWWALPAGWPARWLGLLTMLPLLLVRPVPVAPGAAEVTLLDVGHGLSVVVRTASHALVYDTGPAWSREADAGSRIVLPFLRGEGVRKLDLLLVSHDDIDHSGGALSLMRALPIERMLSSLASTHPIVAQARSAGRCEAGQDWTWDGVRFTILHPSADSYSLRQPDNERSCVLRVEASGQRMLITADIGVASEARLVALARSEAEPLLQADVLIVPHHGSRSSSSPAFIAAVAPRVGLISAGYLNRFGHPRAEVVERYHAANALLLRTDHSGALRIGMNASGVHIVAERERAPRYWRARPGSDG